MENEQSAISNLKSEIYRFLAAHSTLTLATLNPDGQPMAASLFFVADAELNLYWVSGPRSRHSLNLEKNARAAVTVHNETWTWTEIAGVQ
ncbi:MAG: pyridoxamine 5'-phosphate oxidase family protein, partial [Anaerolineales bacterium]